MRRAFLLLVLSALCAAVFGQSSQTLIPDYERLSRPIIKPLPYQATRENGLIFRFGSYRIHIWLRESVEPQAVIYTGNRVVARRKLAFGFDKRYLAGVYTVDTGVAGGLAVLISSYFIGASGLNANMTHGLWIYFGGRAPVVQILSTWGYLNDNFVYRSTDHRLEFVAIDEEKQGDLFIPNYFALTRTASLTRM